MRNAKTIAIALAALAAWLAPATQASAAPAAPAWKLNLIAVPTNLVPGTTGDESHPPVYLLYATNIGAAATTSDQVTMSATFPAGVTPQSSEGASDVGIPTPTCSIAGQSVTCTLSAPIHPSRYSGAQIGVEVSSSLSEGQFLADATATVSGGGATPVSASTPTRIATEPPPFGFLSGTNGLSTLLTNADGSPATQAGGHPDQLTIDVGFPVEQLGTGNSVFTNAGHPRDIVTELPRGLIVNPQATERCTEAELLSRGATSADDPGCPASSQVGMFTIATAIPAPRPSPSALYNMVPPPGSPATLAFDAANVGIMVHLKGGVRSDGDYGLIATSADTLARSLNPILDGQAQLWGDPTGSSHDQIRGECRVTPEKAPCQVERKTTAFLTMPSQCTGPITTAARARSWEEAAEGIEGLPHSAQAQSTDTEGNPVGVSGCNLEEFEPTISAKPTTNLADSPSGLDFALHQPQNQQLGNIAPANMKDATVTLPKGLVVNPSQAGGLEACSSSQIGLTTPIGSKPIHFTKAPDNCPDAAKIGSLEVTTPLLDHPLPGSIYIAKPFDNPFNSLLAIYLSIDDPQSGTVSKLAGEVIPDPVTGQLTNRFTENPELPLEDVKLHLFPGARAALTTPQLCGTHTTSSDLTPWSTPEGLDAHPGDSFQINASPAGSCPASEGGAPNSPAFTAGTVLPQAGAYTPFVLRLSRNDGTQRLKGIEATLPPGLAAKFAGVTTCSDAQIAQAIAREKPNMGSLEKQSPSCPATSAVGTVDVAAGSGPTPFHTEGTAYLAGPYKGAPLSMAIVTPAVAGPFDLGAVVVRTALYVDSVTAQGKAVSDPLPQIIDGIPLDVRSVEVKLDRNQFTLNPTSCEPAKITGTATSAFGGATALSNPFQVGGCKGLDFEPKLSLRLKGGTKRTSHPRLIAILRSSGEEANLAKAQVKLPPSAFLDQAHIKTICTRVQFAVDACPAGSIYGKASVKTPLFENPLNGNVYLRSSNHNLPDLVLDLRGPASQPIKIEVAGKTDSVKGSLRNTFEAVPDAPFETARVELFGGKRGLVVNSRNLCAHNYRADVKLDGQNGKTYDTKPLVKTDCKKKKKKRKHAHKVAKK